MTQHKQRERGPRATTRRRSFFETLEKREVFAPLPVLMVIADRQDFFYQEYGDTKLSIEQAGLTVQVAATTTQPSRPHSGSGEPANGGVVTPDLPLSAVNASNYSAIVFVGGWGSSMYQYAINGNYYDARYNGDPATKAIVNNLISDFVDQDKYVTAICHATTVLAYARVDGVSPIAGKNVTTPQGGATGTGGPGLSLNGVNYNYFQLQQRTMMEWNGGIVANGNSIGDPSSSWDDVVVDGRIITAQDNISAREFGRVIATRLIAEDVPPPPVNHAPVIGNQTFSLAEDSPIGTTAGMVVASDPDLGQEFSYEILAGNTNAAFAIDALTGALNVAFPGAIDFETTPQFQLTIRVTDNGTPSLFSDAIVTVNIDYVAPPPPVNTAPTVAAGQTFALAENSAVGTIVGSVVASDADVGQTLSYSIVGGNTNGAFAINAATGQLSVANLAAVDFETTPAFDLTIRVTDNGNPALSTDAVVRVNLTDVYEAPPGPVYRSGPNVIVQGTSGTDYIYVWTNAAGQPMVWLAGQVYGAFTLGAGGRVIVYGGDGGDYIYATDSTAPVTIYGEGGHDQITGGSASDILDGGAGYDRIWAMGGNDLLIAGPNGALLDGGDGNDMLVGGDADDQLYGGNGNDILIGGKGHDNLEGGAGEDILIGRGTSFDLNLLALQSIFAEWNLSGLAGNTRQTLTSSLINDGMNDRLIGGDGADWLEVFAGDCSYQ
ncbi:cadherin domain-containing protein [Anatilimnocola floriformis]|uniref:cadherin domain-containing protein n=1 Tax=Anatilimnocola floriformis TaxID=2948575 RepID=UPI0021BCA6B9|nr:cadherin domain-containing protein [Anatilimnocola floriformis]